MRREGRKAGGPGRGAPASEGLRHPSATSLDSQQRAEWQRVKDQIRDLNEPLRFSADLRLTAQALSDPRFGPHILRFLVECARSAFSGGQRECHGCCKPWDRKRVPVAVAMVEFLSFEGAAVVGICADCWDRPDRLAVALAGFKRDFGMASAQVATVHEGGRA